ncbi:PilW family protein [Endozoicomonas lisbonensis]|uniref:Type IV pilus assembly protein PilW n=1 Tax=Endozoicomonas lisbonensis TaxID=3120522 RepID=A0ABV2SCR5_9GAMM
MRNYRQAGVSLIELLVAMLLGLFLIAGIGHLFLSANRTYMLQDELSRIQENARFAMDLLARDIRMAGYTGCPAETSLANTIYTTTNSREWMTHFDKGILGISTANKSRIDSSAISEAIVVHKMDAEQGRPVNSHASSSALLNVTSHGVDQGDILALVPPGCDQVSVFKAADGTDGSSISHAAGSSGTLYNCTSQLKGNFNCMDSAAGAAPYSHNQSLLFPVTSVAYYLRTNNSQPNLYRKFAGEYTSGNARYAESLLEGIEGLSFLYGYDSDGNRTPDQYRTADSIGLFSNNWTNVVSVRLELLVRSLSEVAEEPQTYFFAGTQITPADHYIRRNFVMTIELRNRVQP